MRKAALSTDTETGTTRWQEEDVFDIRYHEALGCVRDQYERIDVAVKKAPVEVAAPMATVSRTTADILRNASNLAFALEAVQRGYVPKAALKILAGRHPSGEKMHRKQKNKSQRGK